MSVTAYHHQYDVNVERPAAARALSFDTLRRSLTQKEEPSQSERRLIVL
jgi:hypothetical protein